MPLVFSWNLQWIACIGTWSASNNTNTAHLVLIEWFEDKSLARSDRLTDLCESVCTVSVCTCCCSNAQRVSAFLCKTYHEHFTNRRWGACLRLHFSNNHDVYSVLKLHISNYWEHAILMPTVTVLNLQRNADNLSFSFPFSASCGLIHQLLKTILIALWKCMAQGQPLA